MGKQSADPNRKWTAVGDPSSPMAATIACPCYRDGDSIAHGDLDRVRLIIIIVVMVSVYTATFLLFGEQVEKTLTGDEGLNWLRSFGVWTWLIAIGLILSDVVLPIPATVVMSALGIIYGAVLGGLIGAVGSMSAGLAAYGAARLIGKRAAVFLVGERDLERARSFFERAGGWAVVMSRPLPMLPEVVACLAGMAGMPARRFVPALACGSLPLSFIAAALGALGAERPWLAFIASGLIPLALWPIANRLLSK